MMKRETPYFVLSVKEYFHPRDGCNRADARQKARARAREREREREREGIEAGEWKMNENEGKESSNKPARDDEWPA